MKRAFYFQAWTALCLLAGTRAAQSSPPILGTDALGLPYRALFQTDARPITAVRVTGDILRVEFTGQWISSPKTKFPSTDKGSFTIHRGKGASQVAWEDLERRFSEYRGKGVTILVFVDKNYLNRGGNVSFSFPQDRFQLIMPEQKFDFSVGYKF